jgi:hypothetical protein
MADVRPPGGPALPVPTAPVRPAVRAAQQAFFRQAMAAEPAAPAPKAAPRPAPAAQPPAPDPARPLRPGSLLDIKV